MRRFAVVFAAMLVATLAHAQSTNAPPPSVLSTISRAEMIALMQQAGFTSVSDRTTDEATPWVQGTMPTGDTAVIYFYECESEVTGPQQHCAHMNFNMFWNNTKNTDAAAVNNYNTQRVFGRGSVSADGKYVTFDYAMDIEGGVTNDAIAKNLAYFELALADFKTMVNP